VSDRLPLFPLGLVLLPGLVLPLHVFEERYRRLVEDLLALPEPERRFGVVAIRSGREVGAGGARDLHEVGCVARLRQVTPHDDGRFDLLTTGAERFRLDALDLEGPYPTGSVTLLADVLAPPGGAAGEAALLDAAVRASFTGYLTALGEVGVSAEELDLPGDSLALSYVVAASVQVDLEDRQRLLACPDGTTRLRAELALLRRETTLLGALSAVPAPELARGPVSPN
jgi:Lon protease-like protein